MKEAADCALDVRDFFRRTSEADGVPFGLVPRIALHVGEIIIAGNPLLGRADIFGDAVHLAARLEPVTGRGQVYCTPEFAQGLEGIRGTAASAHPLGEVMLPKGFGTVQVFAVTGPNEEPPAAPPAPMEASCASAPDRRLQATEPLSDDETAALLRVVLRSLPAKSTSFTYEQLVQQCHPLVDREAIKRVLPQIVQDTDWLVTIGQATVSFEYQMPEVIVTSKPRRGW